MFCACEAPSVPSYRQVKNEGGIWNILYTWEVVNDLTFIQH